MISYLRNNQKSQLFIKSKREAPRYILWLCFTCCLMLTDLRFHRMDGVRSLLSYVTFPIQTLSELPFHFLNTMSVYFRSKQELRHENNRLNIHQLMLQEELQHLQSLRQENRKLKGLLDLSEVTGHASLAARVLSIQMNLQKQVVTLDKGTKDHVFVGQPVLDQHGVMGQVIHVTPTTSTVLLISDNLSAVPVKNNRTGELAILAGTGHMDKLVLLNIPKTSSVTTGDLWITSGLGQRYPEGYPVGRVSAVLNKPGDDFIQVELSPIATLNRSQLVLLIWPGDYQSVLSTHFIHQPYMRYDA